jgi:DNA-binding CsgD family transcriptional regulator
MGPKSIPISDLFDGIAALYAVATEDKLLSHLIEFIEKWIPVQHADILEFKKGLQPRSLKATAGGYDHDLSKYLNGLYLLDPYYDLYENQDRTGIFKLNLEDWDNFSSTEDYKHYWRRFVGNNEVAGLYEIAEQHCIHVSFMIQTEDQQLVQDAVELMRLLESNFCIMFRNYFYSTGRQWITNEIDRREIHTTVSAVLENFGSDVLSDREQEIVRLLLKGHSAKSIATLLDITAGTVSVHRSNIYQKLAVAGQGDLFSKFVASLTNLQ